MLSKVRRGISTTFSISGAHLSIRANLKLQSFLAIYRPNLLPRQTCEHVDPPVPGDSEEFTHLFGKLADLKIRSPFDPIIVHYRYTSCRYPCRPPSSRNLFFAVAEI